METFFLHMNPLKELQKSSLPLVVLSWAWFHKFGFSQHNRFIFLPEMKDFLILKQLLKKLFLLKYYTQTCIYKNSKNT